MKRFLFCLFFLLLLCKANDIATNFDVLKCQESKEIFSKDSFFTIQAIGKNESKKILLYYALSKIHLRKHKTCFRFTLLISSDINLISGPYADILSYCNSSLSINYSGISLASNDENPDIEKWKNFKKKRSTFRSHQYQ